MFVQGRIGDLLCPFFPLMNVSKLSLNDWSDMENIAGYYVNEKDSSSKNYYIVQNRN